MLAGKADAHIRGAAWKMTGWPWGERWMLSRPSTWKKRPL
ncbi:hypothetical protein SAMCCGM7_pB0258 (plasmid) [Sinorhizobium americanum CCGM7]|nr:hypothetical protein SAMCCGM7_pB0258 [Sinorhizobium americanum CCGM7]